MELDKEDHSICAEYIYRVRGRTRTSCSGDPICVDPGVKTERTQHPADKMCSHAGFHANDATRKTFEGRLQRQPLDLLAQNTLTRVVKADQVERVFANIDTDASDLFWGFGFCQSDGSERPVWRHMLQRSLWPAAAANKCFDSNTDKPQRPQSPAIC